MSVESDMPSMLDPPVKEIRQLLFWKKERKEKNRIDLKEN